jgi:hypothetical protein
MIQLDKQLSCDGTSSTTYYSTSYISDKAYLTYVTKYATVVTYCPYVLEPQIHRHECIHPLWIHPSIHPSIHASIHALNIDCSIQTNPQNVNQWRNL